MDVACDVIHVPTLQLAHMSFEIQRAKVLTAPTVSNNPTFMHILYERKLFPEHRLKVKL